MSVRSSCGLWSLARGSGRGVWRLGCPAYLVGGCVARLSALGFVVVGWSVLAGCVLFSCPRSAVGQLRRVGACLAAL
jgi:hypothetical protein